MSFLLSQVIEMESRFGKPDHLATVIQTPPQEVERIRRSMKYGRAHDITLFISHDHGYIFIAKPFYPPGLFRAPSGGVHLGEDFEQGARREALEETGVEIELERYILNISVRFDSGDTLVDWTTYIFKARYVSGDIRPRDRHEISAARLVYLNEIPKFREIMLADGRGGFRYRAFLTDETLKRL